MSRLLDISITPLPGAIEPVTLEEAKVYLRVDFDDDDAVITRMIRSSVQRLQKYSGRVFTRSNCSAYYRQECGGDRILLAYNDNISLTTGDYVDKLKGGTLIETTDTDVEIDYEAGYTVIPDWITTAVLQDVAWMYENRGDVTQQGKINPEVREFLRPFVKWSLL